MSIPDPHEAAAIPGSPDAASTPLSRLVPALMMSNVGTFIALLTPLQLLLTLRLTDLADGADATAAFGIVTGLGALAGLVANVVAGRISDLTAARFGRRRTWILTGALVGSAGLVGLAYTTALWQVALIWCVVTTLFNFQYSATTAVVADQVPATRRGGVSGLLGIGLTVGPLLGIAVANSLPAGGPSQWLVVAAVAIVLGIVSVALMRDQPARRRDEKLGLAGIVQTFWRNPRDYPAFGWAWVVRFLITCAYASSSYTAFFLIQRFDVSTEKVGSLVLLSSFITVGLASLTGVVGGYVSDAIQRQKPFVVAAGVIAAAGLVTVAFAPSVTVVLVGLGLIGFGTGLFMSIDLAMCVRVLPSSEDAGKDLGIINIANTLPQSLVPFLAPTLLALGGYNLLYLSLAVLGLLGALAVSKVPEIGQEAGGRFVAPLVRERVPAVPARSGQQGGR